VYFGYNYSYLNPCSCKVVLFIRVMPQREDFASKIFSEIFVKWKDFEVCLQVWPPVHTYLHTYVCTYIITYMRMYIHTYIHTYVHTYLHTCIHTYVHTYIHTCRQTDRQTDTQTHTHTYHIADWKDFLLPF